MPLQTILGWLPQIAIAALAGFIHQWLATRELTKSLRRFPFFNPGKSLTYWIYKLFAFFLAAFVFWFVVPTIFRIAPPSIQRNWKDANLWGMALAVGFYFRHFLDAPISIVALGVFDIGPGYHKLVSIFHDTIVKALQDNNQDFWQEVGQELRAVAAKTGQQNYTNGYQFLSDSLRSEMRIRKGTIQLQTLERRLDAILPQRFVKIQPPSFRADLSETTIELLDWLLDEGLISRSRLPKTLRAFGCDRCIQQYFPNATKGSRSRS